VALGQDELGGRKGVLAPNIVQLPHSRVCRPPRCRPAPTHRDPIRRQPAHTIVVVCWAPRRAFLCHCRVQECPS
jgi:hypothetical protein